MRNIIAKLARDSASRTVVGMTVAKDQVISHFELLLKRLEKDANSSVSSAGFAGGVSDSGNTILNEDDDFVKPVFRLRMDRMAGSATDYHVTDDE